MKDKPIYEQLGYDPDPPFYAPTSKPIVTNYDRIIRQTPEEMAEWISAITLEEFGDKKDWLHWLKQEETMRRASDEP